MSEAYVGEIRLFGGNFAPVNWALCNGQALAISEYEALFVILGTTYGGDGVTTFNLPNLQGRIALHMGTSPFGNTFVEGQAAGESQHLLTIAETPQHIHILSPTTSISQTVATDSGTTNTPGPTAILAKALKGATPVSIYVPSATYPATATTLPLKAVGTTDQAGGSLPHPNLQPFLAVTFIICLFGIFPTRN